ncbi:MAG: Ribonucleotide reductase transcriptional regulator NrdR [uncultured Chloroflexi bacterium]|uniref:Transcriptional repressor NrdR n=1 Tax=uncultured Chloroflexota bacterium TaxID=166587 RepID=A0A6J4JL43_9CHLR|nr:MAG: Ribonucleotide reductase transcriptional regulator NrdR [uncultured Chloroflexota bacterium]
MRCPSCHSDDLRVLETREGDNAIRRRRRCEACGRRFSTTERIDATTLLVVKRDGRREEYDRAKVLRGVRIACEKRPIPAETIERLADEVERDLARDGAAEAPSTRVGDLVIEKLLALDPIAYIRFASVYRDMATLEAIRRELDALLEQGLAARPRD